jgi:hypothetical protein
MSLCVVSIDMCFSWLIWLGIRVYAGCVRTCLHDWDIEWHMAYSACAMYVSDLPQLQCAR